MKLKFSLKFMLGSVALLCVTIFFIVAGSSLLIKRIGAATEARTLSQYLWRVDGDYAAACDQIASETPSKEGLFTEHWKQTNILVGDEHVIAFRITSAGGLTYFVTSDFNVRSETTRAWINKTKVPRTDNEPDTVKTESKSSE